MALSKDCLQSLHIACYYFTCTITLNAQKQDLRLYIIIIIYTNELYRYSAVDNEGVLMIAT